MPWTHRSLAETISSQMDDYRKQVGKRLLALRKGKGWNQEDAAHAVGVAVKTWQNWERGLRMPYDNNFRKLGEAFSVDPSEIRGMVPAPLGLDAPGAEPDVGIEAKLANIETMLRGLTATVEALANQQSELLAQTAIREGEKDSSQARRPSKRRKAA